MDRGIDLTIELLEDFADEVTQEIAKYEERFNLSPERMLAEVTEIEELNWSYIPYGPIQINDVPDDQRGLYAFVVCNENGIFPPHHYVMYIGIAGKKSNRPLRARYQDYLNPHKVIKRSKIARMIGIWHSVLRFYFAPVNDEVDSNTLEAIEKALNNALMPPCSKRDLSVELKKKKGAF